MTLSRLLRSRGVEPVVLERMPAGHYIPRGYMLGFQGYEPLEEVGVYDEVRDAGRPIAPRPDQPPVAVAVRFGALIEALQREPADRQRAHGRRAGEGGRPRGRRRGRGAGGAHDLRCRPGGGLRRHAVADARDGRPGGQLRRAARGRARLHEPVGGRHVVRDGLHVRRRTHRDALVERGLRRLAQRRAGRPRGGPRPRPRRHQGDVGTPAPAGRLGDRGRRPRSTSSATRSRCCSPAPAGGRPGWCSSATRPTSSAPRPGSARASAWATPTRWPRRSRRTPATPTPPASATRPGARRPSRPYEANDPGRARMVLAGQVEPRPEERWPISA